MSNALGPFTRGSATSLAAAVDNYPRSGTQRQAVLDAIVAAENEGRTRDELVAHLGLLDSATDARVWELLRDGLIERSGEKRRTRSGSNAEVLVASRAVDGVSGAPQAAIPLPQGPDPLPACAWCGEPALSRIEVAPPQFTHKRGIKLLKRRAIEAPVCATHAQTIQRTED